MANICFYMMKVTGKKENVDKFMQYINDYSIPNHFKRMEIDADFDEEDLGDGNIARILNGNCACSLESAGILNRFDLFANAIALCNVNMEAWSEESGLAFQEHFIYEYGKPAVRKCTDWTEYYYSGELPFDEWCKENDLPSDIELDENDCYCTGGFDDYGTWRI